MAGKSGEERGAGCFCCLTVARVSQQARFHAAANLKPGSPSAASAGPETQADANRKWVRARFPPSAPERQKRKTSGISLICERSVFSSPRRAFLKFCSPSQTGGGQTDTELIVTSDEAPRFPLSGVVFPNASFTPLS